MLLSFHPNQTRRSSQALLVDPENQMINFSFRLKKDGNDDQVLYEKQMNSHTFSGSLIVINVWRFYRCQFVFMLGIYPKN